ncbi:nuclear transport factor 2 family protein [Streptomyces sp. I05A-00742]|uniref:nuclear transport factor 2 family protein n=1 Tax=Streptomyces sp. I05A-00742 TaxID=2732853 RepID=UPI00148982B7|nr:nuclear transport factor 2 family protein [Streptomyces sp. I05A-00742]
MTTAADRFRTAVEQHDLAALEDLLTDDITFNSPVTFTPFKGKSQVIGLFRILLRTFEDFRYVGSCDGTAEPLTDGTPTPATVLVFRAGVNGKEIHGIDLLHTDDSGRIRTLTVMVRPHSAVRALGDAVYAGLVADGLVPAPPAA